jgi:RNA polymerase sigma-70 factor (ECF subfamily)
MNSLLTTHYGRIFAICRRLAGNDADAADASQEALMAIVKGLHRFDGRATFKTWSYRVATNAALDELRRRKRRPMPALADIEVPSGSPSLDSEVVDRLTVDALLPRIPEEFQAPVILRDLLGMDYAEIAQTLEIPPGTVRSRIARGRRHLAKLLEEPGNQTGPEKRQ